MRDSGNYNWFARVAVIRLVSFFLIFSFSCQAFGKELGKDKHNKVIVFAISNGQCDFCTKTLNAIYTELFSRLGMEFKYILLPHKRSILESNKGGIDGESARLEFDDELISSYPNLIQVKESIWRVVIGAFTHIANIKINSWKDLPTQGVIVGYPRGHLYIENQLRKNHFPTQNLWNTTDIEQAIMMLSRKRLDIFIESVISFENILAKFSDQEIRYAGYLDFIPLYPYLNKKHAKLVPLVETCLKAMKDDGTYMRLAQKYRSLSQ